MILENNCKKLYKVKNANLQCKFDEHQNIGFVVSKNSGLNSYI